MISSAIASAAYAASTIPALLARALEVDRERITDTLHLIRDGLAQLHLDAGVFAILRRLNLRDRSIEVRSIERALVVLHVDLGVHQLQHHARALARLLELRLAVTADEHARDVRHLLKADVFHRALAG